MILEMSLRGPFIPGSNVQRLVADSSWLLLLPTLELRRAVVIGDPGSEIMHSLHLFADEVVELTPSVRSVELDCDLVVVATRRSMQSIRLQPQVATWSRCRRWNSQAPMPRLWLVPAGEANAPSVPAGPVGLPFGITQRAMPTGPLQALQRARGVAARVKRRIASASGRAFLPGAPRDNASVSQRRPGDPDRGGSFLALSARPTARPPASVLEIADDDEAGAVPRWVRSVAATHGFEIDPANRWTVNVDADYRSQKALFRVSTHERGEELDLAVKVTRDPQFSARLRNEYDGLRRLEGLEVANHAPRPVFAGEHRGLAVVGETMVEGLPFSSYTDLTPSCGHLERALEWGLLLGAEAQLRATAPSSDLEDALERLAGQFRRTCRPEAAVLAMVEHDISSLVQVEPFPTVFLHGDLGTWNILVSPRGAIRVLDWENADPRGLPCWDVAQLVMSQAQRSAAAAGRRYSAGAAVSTFAPGSQWHELLASAIRRSTADADIDERLGAALVRLSWVHLAVKASTRRTASKGGTSFHARLLDAIAHRGTRDGVFG